MSALSSIIMGQIIWFVAATLFNLGSWLAISAGNAGWAGNTPLQAQIFVCVFGMLIIAGLFDAQRVLKYVGPLVVIVLALGGVGRHLIAPSSDYASTLSWAIAVSINVLGVIAFALGVFAAWRSVRG